MDAQHNTTISPRLVKPSRQQLEKAAVLFFLVHECLSVTKGLVKDLEHHSGVSLCDINARSIRSIPGEEHNIILSEECLRKFGPTLLTSSGLFYSFTREGSVCYCDEWNSECVCAQPTWRLDVSPIYERGLLLPICDRRYGFYSDLMIFRHVRDEHPFILKLRADQEMAA